MQERWEDPQADGIPVLNLLDIGASFQHPAPEVVNGEGGI